MFKFLYTYRRLIIITLVFFAIWVLVFRPFGEHYSSFSTSPCPSMYEYCNIKDNKGKIIGCNATCFNNMLNN